MPTFIYKALNESRKVNNGQITAKNREEVAEMLTKKGLSPLSIKEDQAGAIIKGSVPTIEKITFCRYLSVMMATGLSLSEGIDVLRNESKNKLMRQVLSDMGYSLEQGQQLSDIFRRYPGVFENYFLTLIKAGEVSGKLSDIFKYLEAELRSEYSLNAKVKGALIYPAIVFSAMLAIGILMFFFVLPQIGKVFLSMKLPLPAFTKFMFSTSIILSKYFIQIIVSGVVTLVVGFLLMKKRAVRDAFLILLRPIPLVRNLILKIDLARFNRIFSMLIRSAVPITDAMEISLSTLTWPQLRALSSTLPNEMKRGIPISKLFKETNVFPSLMVQMAAAGEKTATLDSTLNDLAKFYAEEVEEEVKSLTQIIEPVLMLLVGIAVGVMILSIIAPIYSVVGNFQQAAGGPAGPR